MAIALLIIDIQQGMFMLSRPPHQGIRWLSGLRSIPPLCRPRR